MLCTKCKKNEATVFYEENINGAKRKFALCSDCAARMRESGEWQFDLSDPFSAFGHDDILSSLFGETPSVVSPRTKRCELCGLRFSDIMAQGKVGCPMCYTVFADELEPTIYSIHGTSKHRGRRPSLFKKSEEATVKPNTDETKTAAPSSDTAEDKKETVTDLRERLNRAIESEDFEQAAKLRDEIKRMEGRA